VFYANFSNISAISWDEQILKYLYDLEHIQKTYGRKIYIFILQLAAKASIYISHAMGTSIVDTHLQYMYINRHDN